MAGQREDATETIQQALEAGLTEDLLHPLERSAFRRLTKLVE